MRFCHCGKGAAVTEPPPHGGRVLWRGLRHRLDAGRACPALLDATPKAGGRLDADHRALGSAVSGWHRARGSSPVNKAMASSRIGEKGNARTATRRRVRGLALPEAMRGAGQMPTLLLRRESNHGCGSRDIPAGAAGISRKPRMRLLVTRSRGATGRIRQRRIHWRGSPRHRSARSPGDGLLTPSPHPEVRCITRPRHGCHDPHVTLPRGALASTILDRRKRSTFWPQEPATESRRSGFSKAGKR